jgi:heterodisulfide reductase subunit C
MNKSELLKEQVQRNSGVNVLKCMRCGKCSGTCPNYDVMEYHPHEFVNMVENNQVELLMKSDSLYMCLTCFACVERCPRGVEPGKLVEAIRLEAVRLKENNHLKPDQIVEKLTDKMPQQAIVTAFRKYTK